MTRLLRSRYAHAGLLTIAFTLAARHEAEAQFWTTQAGPAQVRETLTIRGHAQSLHLLSLIHI